MKLQRNADGTLSAGAIQQIEESLLSITDAIGGLMDRVMQRGFIPAFRCCHSGLLLPGDYVKEWGRLYGIGLGAQPVSEVLDTDYHARLPELTADIRDIEQIMHPVNVCAAQVDFLLVDQRDQLNYAVMAHEDPKIITRGRIVRAKQMTNKNGKLHLLVAKAGGLV